MQKQQVKIKTSFQIPDGSAHAFKLYLHSLELQIAQLFSDQLKDCMTDIQFIELFSTSLPLIHYTYTDEAPYIVAITVICHSQYTHGAGRFISDLCSRWLIPGKQLPIVNVNSLVFEFEIENSPSYFVHEVLLKVECEKSLKQLKSNIDHVAREIKLNIMAVEHARTIVSLKPLTIDQKNRIIQENIASLLDRPSKDFDLNTFDQMHHAILQILGEEKTNQVIEQVASLHDARPHVFERDVFNDLQHFINLFKDPFTALRDARHITRIAAYMYLFRKTLNNSVFLEPYKRHLSFKILKSQIHSSDDGHQILGIIIGINLLRETELFEEKHILEAIRSCLPDLNLVKEYSIIDRRGADRIRILYLEIAKEDQSAFDVNEIKTLKNKLAFELKNGIENMINPVFMPRNEEEVLRNILTLSKQLKYVQDIPQIMISFHKQTDKMISFTVVLLRLLKKGSIPLKTVFSIHSSPSIYFDNLDTKIVGQLRKKYHKEANVFEVLLSKDQFLRKDYSLDLFEARKKVYSTLTEMLGELRDYNGGMISKQSEVFKQLHQLVKKHHLHNDFLLKNFFYSITPVYMQSLLPPKILKTMFLMFNHVLHHDYNDSAYFLEQGLEDGYFIVMLGSINPAFNNFISKQVDDSSFAEQLTFLSITTHDISCLGYLLKFEHMQEQLDFSELIDESILEWKNRLVIQTTYDPLLLPQKKEKQLSGSI